MRTCWDKVWGCGGAFAAVAVLGLAAGCGGATRPAKPPVTTVGVPAPAPSASTAPAPPQDPALVAKLAFQQNLQRTLAVARDAGWVENRFVTIPGHDAAIVVYEPTPDKAGATIEQRVDAIGAGAGNVVTRQSGMIDVKRTPAGKLLWNLRGKGANSVVIELTPCGAHCGTPEPLVLDLVHDRFVVPASAPACPTCIHDLDSDGVPEFDVPLLQLSIAPCAYVSCGSAYALEVDVDGYESWDGRRFAKNLKLFEPLYDKALDKARQEAKKLAAASKSGVCPTDALRVAGELYAYGRLTGQPVGTALAAADGVMSGYSMQPCTKQHTLLAAPRRWSLLRRELSKTQLPTLDAKRTK